MASPAALPGLMARIAELPALLSGTLRYDEVFAPGFRNAVPEPELHKLLAQLSAGAGKPLAVEQTEATSPCSATVQLRAERALIGLQLTVEAEPPHRISGLLFTGLVAPEASLPAILDALRSLPGRTGLAVARLEGNAPTPWQRLAAEQDLSIGSVFKLVVLAEAIRAIRAGERHWDDAVPIDGRLLPAGRYTALPAGTTVPLQELVQAMISVSDNSATDILIATLGRDRMEAMLPELGLARPGGLRPFLFTLEAFKLKAMIAAGQTAWLHADEAERRLLLSGPVAALPLDGIDEAFTAQQPLSIETVEWRASPDDVIRLLDWIRRHTEHGPAATARTILAINPGIGPQAAAGWRFLGYKGGSEPGVIAMGFLLQKPSGTWLAVAAGWNDPEHPVDEARFALLVSRLVELLRAET